MYFEINEKRFVIEFQCSPIATEYIERHRLYELAGVNDIWILGTEKYIEKSEIGNKFKEKTIEKYVNYYFDVEYKIFIMNNINHFNINEFKITSVYGYYEQNKRELMSTDLLLYVKNIQKYMINFCHIEFNDGKFLFDLEAINNIKIHSKILIEEESRQQEIKRIMQEHEHNCNLFITHIFEYFKQNFNIDFDWMSRKCGFKYSKHYYQLVNIDNNYPNVDFCEIIYINNKPVHSLVFNVDIEKESDRNKIIDFLSMELKDIIKSNMEFNDFEMKSEKEKKDELIKLKQELLQFNDKPLYLLFLEDNCKINKNIRFKIIHNYPNNIIDIAKTILENLKFINSKNAKEYVLMIPKKRIKESSSIYYPYYTVRNYKSTVKDEFNELGISFLEYKDLLEVKNAQ